MLICHRVSSKCINVLDSGTDAMVPSVGFFLPPIQSSCSQNKYKPEDRREKEGKMGEKEGERKEERKQANPPKPQNNRSSSCIPCLEGVRQFHISSFSEGRGVETKYIST